MHSPLVFQLMTEVLPPSRLFYSFTEIEALRNDLERSNQLLKVEDFGAGSRKSAGSERKISSIATTALQSKHCAQALFRIIDFYRPQNILELGTSLGITTSYLARANESAMVHTIEGSAEVGDVAKEVFLKQHIKNIVQHIGPFDAVLPQLLKEFDRIDFALIDGNHRLEPTLRYFELIRDKCNENSMIVLDDIHWSKEMNDAWQKIISMAEVSVSIDFFHFGMVYFRRGIEKQNFVLRMPR